MHWCASFASLASVTSSCRKPQAHGQARVPKASLSGIAHTLSPSGDRNLQILLRMSMLRRHWLLHALLCCSNSLDVDMRGELPSGVAVDESQRHGCVYLVSEGATNAYFSCSVDYCPQL